MSFRQLMETLEQLHLLYTELYELGLVKKDQVVKNQINDLTATIAKESKVLKQISENETVRRQTLIELQREMGVRPKLYITLTEISRMLFSVEDKQELGGIQGKLTEIVAALKPLNELNQHLIQQSVALLEFSLDLLVGSPTEEVTYQNPAMHNGKQNRNGLFDTRA
ncbi:flagellar protein FlgN [Paenibacillus oenotherae]|uniref:Flagellar protein FlgN n=1 Tax=Paenibacillus oenotherae TaxID=1435645 RepID=A0ABS7D674_9BACL|nr:flagellar protein FlgN [Paenibacillus oenotherae]